METITIWIEGFLIGWEMGCHVALLIRALTIQRKEDCALWCYQMFNFLVEDVRDLWLISFHGEYSYIMRYIKTQTHIHAYTRKYRHTCTIIRHTPTHTSILILYLSIQRGILAKGKPGQRQRRGTKRNELNGGRATRRREEEAKGTR